MLSKREVVLSCKWGGGGGGGGGGGAVKAGESIKCVGCTANEHGRL